MKLADESVGERDQIVAIWLDFARCGINKVCLNRKIHRA
jgi:hypothetical protein